MLSEDQVRELLKEEIKQTGMTQAQVGELMGRGQAWVSKKLSGKAGLNGRARLTIDDLSRFAEALDLPISAIIADHEQRAS